MFYRSSHLHQIILAAQYDALVVSFVQIKWQRCIINVGVLGSISNVMNPLVIINIPNLYSMPFLMSNKMPIDCICEMIWIKMVPDGLDSFKESRATLACTQKKGYRNSAPGVLLLQIANSSHWKGSWAHVD